MPGAGTRAIPRGKRRSPRPGRGPATDSAPRRPQPPWPPRRPSNRLYSASRYVTSSPAGSGQAPAEERARQPAPPFVPRSGKRRLRAAAGDPPSSAALPASGAGSRGTGGGGGGAPASSAGGMRGSEKRSDRRSPRATRFLTCWGEKKQPTPNNKTSHSSSSVAGRSVAAAGAPGDYSCGGGRDGTTAGIGTVSLHRCRV